LWWNVVVIVLFSVADGTPETVTDAINRLTESNLKLLQKFEETMLGAGAGTGAGTRPVHAKTPAKAAPPSASVSSITCTAPAKSSPPNSDTDKTVSFSDDTKSGDVDSLVAGDLPAAAAAHEVGEMSTGTSTNPHYSQDSFEAPRTESGATTRCHSST
jgi:hypothetical protein